MSIEIIYNHFGKCQNPNVKMRETWNWKLETWNKSKSLS